jgi:hypothetical protein
MMFSAIFMPIWVTAVLIPLLIAATNLAAQFYFKLVPNTEDQKRHLKTAGAWALDIIGFAIQGYGLYLIAQRKQAVTPGYVLTVAACACATTLGIVSFAYRRLEGPRQMRSMHVLMNVFDDHFTLIKGQSEILAEHTRILERIVYPDLSPETVSAMQSTLDTSGERD